MTKIQVVVLTIVLYFYCACSEQGDFLSCVCLPDNIGPFQLAEEDFQEPQTTEPVSSSILRNFPFITGVIQVASLPLFCTEATSRPAMFNLAKSCSLLSASACKTCILWYVSDLFILSLGILFFVADLQTAWMCPVLPQCWQSSCQKQQLVAESVLATAITVL